MDKATIKKLIDMELLKNPHKDLNTFLKRLRKSEKRYNKRTLQSIINADISDAKVVQNFVEDLKNEEINLKFNSISITLTTLKKLRKKEKEIKNFKKYGETLTPKEESRLRMIKEFSVDWDVLLVNTKFDRLKELDEVTKNHVMLEIAKKDALDMIKRNAIIELDPNIPANVNFLVDELEKYETIKEANPKTNCIYRVLEKKVSSIDKKEIKILCKKRSKVKGFTNA